MVEAEAPPDIPAFAPRTSADDARTRFARAFYCPESRITVTPVDRPVGPPADVAGDAGRLEIWRARNGPQPRVFDVSGCDRHVRLVCPPVVAGGDPNPLCVRDTRGESPSAVDVAPEAAAPAIAATDSTAMRLRPGAGAGFEPSVGVVVRSVVPGGPADGKLHVGDLILTAGGREVRDEQALQAIVHAHAGLPLDFRIRRGDRDFGTAFVVGAE